MVGGLVREREVEIPVAVDVEHDRARRVRVRLRVDVGVGGEVPGAVVDEDVPLLPAEARDDPVEVAVAVEVTQHGADLRAARVEHGRQLQCAVAVAEEDRGAAAVAVHRRDVQLSIAVHIAEDELPHGAAGVLGRLGREGAGGQQGAAEGGV